MAIAGAAGSCCGAASGLSGEDGRHVEVEGGRVAKTKARAGLRCAGIGAPGCAGGRGQTR